MSNRQMNCEEAKPLFSEHIDGELKGECLERLEAHLRQCQGCGRGLEGLRTVGRLLRELPKEPLPLGLLERVRSGRSSSPARPFLALAFAAAGIGFVLLRPAPPAAPRRGIQGPLAEMAQPPEPRARPAPYRDGGEPILGAAPKAQEAPAQPALAGGRPAYEPTPVGFDNLAQAKRLQRETGEIGIQSVGSQPEPEAPEPFLGRQLGTPEVRRRADESVRQLIAMRRAIEDAGGRRRPAAISGSLAPVLAQEDQANGAAVEQESARRWEGNFSGGNEAGTRTISEEKAWKALWKTLTPAKPAPKMDFARDEAVAIFLGPRPTGGFRVEILSTDADEAAVTVRYREKTPQPGLPAPEGATAPYALLAIPKSDLPVRFEKTQ